MPDTTPTDSRTAHFVNLIMMLSTSAMQHLGKLVHPMTGKTEVSLEAAQATIDMLDMLKARTRGNLDKAEQSILDEVLAMLQMNYVETAAAAPARGAGDPAAAQASAQPAEGPDAPTPADDAPPTDPPTTAAASTPRYHKSYGG